MEKSDQALLETFLKTGSDQPFEILVRRHVGVVFGAALRITRNREWAEDTTQLVFAILLRKAGGVMRHPSLPAWLHKTATLEAMRLMRKERNHQRKLQRFSEMTVNSQPAEIPNPVDSPVLDHLDEAMAALGPIDRHFLMLRFYQGYGMRELASVLGKSEATVRKQSERTLARLRRILHRRGVDASTIALSGLLSSAFAHPASATLITTITQGAAATSASVLPSALVINTLQTMTYGKQIALTAATVALLAAIPVGIQTKRLEDTKSELHTAHAVADPRPKTLTAAQSDTISYPSANSSTPTPETSVKRPRQRDIPTPSSSGIC